MTEIVYQSYLNYDQDDIDVVTDFKWRGFFTESLLDKCNLKLTYQSDSFRESEVEFKNGFIKLLEFLRIIASLSKQDDSVIYFMPSILSTCNFGDDQHIIPTEVLPEETVVCDKTEPLLIQFKLHDSMDKPGSFPRGTFCCLIVELLQERSTWHLYWSDNEEKVFDNLVTLLHLETGQYITLIDRIFYLEVIMLQEGRTGSCFIQYKVKQMLKEALKKIGLKLNFEEFVLSFGYICYKCLRKGKHVVMDTTYAKLCCCHGHTLLKMDKHTIWDKVVKCIILVLVRIIYM